MAGTGRTVLKATVTAGQASDVVCFTTASTLRLRLLGVPPHALAHDRPQVSVLSVLEDASAPSPPIWTRILCDRAPLKLVLDPAQ